MADVKKFITNFISVIIAIVFGVSLVPVVNSSITGANLSGTQAVIAQLIPLLVIVGLFTYAIFRLY